jgi:predicted ATPase
MMHDAEPARLAVLNPERHASISEDFTFGWINMAPRHRTTSLPSPFLKRIVLREDVMEHEDGYPFNLGWIRVEDFELEFTTPITIIVGENGTGKSTLLEGIAALSGYDEAGGGKGYRPVDHTLAIDTSGAALSRALRASWLPKVTTGWFFRAESFYSVARYLDYSAIEAGGAPPDFLSWSHGEGFIRFFEERCSRQGIYFMDEPESALSPTRQLALIRLLNSMHASAKAQVIMATHSPLLMACPHARLLELTHSGIAEIDFRDTEHFKLYRDFVEDPHKFIEAALAREEELLR